MFPVGRRCTRVGLLEGHRSARFDKSAVAATFMTDILEATVPGYARPNS
ncbi:MAG TPA: hypothetical protein VFX51_17545 [Solirubrobacteraceae bacterium]|nr:hypothetical protein [Solirubrobacteraceae bacterium]